MSDIKNNKELTEEQEHTIQFLEALKKSELTPSGYYYLSTREREAFDERIAKELGVSKNDLKQEFSVQRTLFSTRRYNVEPENPNVYRSFEDDEIYRIFGPKQRQKDIIENTISKLEEIEKHVIEDRERENNTQEK